MFRGEKNKGCGTNGHGYGLSSKRTIAEWISLARNSRCDECCSLALHLLGASRQVGGKGGEERYTHGAVFSNRSSESVSYFYTTGAGFAKVSHIVSRACERATLSFTNPGERDFHCVFAILEALFTPNGPESSKLR